MSPASSIMPIISNSWSARARTCCALSGIDQRAAIESGQGVYVVAEARIKYRGSAKLDDDLLVLTDVVAVRAASCLIQQRVMRGADLLADAMITAAFISPDGRPQRQPRAWMREFRDG